MRLRQLRDIDIINGCCLVLFLTATIIALAYSV